MGIRQTLANWIAPERRSYSDLVLAGLISGAEGNLASAGATAAQEACAGLWGRAFAAAAVEPAQFQSALSPEVLAAIGRALIRRGEIVFAIDVVGGAVQLREAGAWEVSGVSRPWQYQLDIPSPSGSQTIRRGAESVLHLMYAHASDSPWRGLSPLKYASDSANLLGRLEGKLSQEMTGVCGSVLPVPSEVGTLEDGSDPFEALKADIRMLKGGTALVETTSSGWGDGRAAAPQSDWTPKRLGPNPPESLNLFRTSAERSILFCAGIPPSLLDSNSATAAREGWRQFLHATISPVARLVAAECSAKFAREVRFSFDDLMASDIASRARAYKGLLDAGMDASRAERICGFAG